MVKIEKLVTGVAVLTGVGIGGYLLYQKVLKPWLEKTPPAVTDVVTDEIVDEVIDITPEPVACVDKDFKNPQLPLGWFAV